MRETLKRLLLVPLAAAACSMSLRAETIYFLVANWMTPHDWTSPEYEGDSYVVPIPQPDFVKHARRLVAEGPGIGAFMPIGKVVGGKDGINRDLLAPGKPEWSWHVAEFWGFGESEPGIGFGGASGLEAAWQEWLQTGGEGEPPPEYLVAAWLSYTVVAELGPAFSLTMESGSQGLTFRWPDLSTNQVYALEGTNFVYTVETKSSLMETNWMPVAGAVWPVKTNRWTPAAPASASSFFRVKAELAPP